MFCFQETIKKYFDVDEDDGGFGGSWKRPKVSVMVSVNLSFLSLTFKSSTYFVFCYINFYSNLILSFSSSLSFRYGPFRMMYGTFWKIFFYMNTPKIGWNHQTAYHVKAFIVYKSGQCIAFNKNDVWLKILGRTVPFVQDTFSVPYKRHCSSQYLQSFIILIKSNALSW